MAVEDTLEVQVKTEADKATKSLDAMIDKIGGIANALNKIDVSRLSNVFGNLQKSMNGINSQISNMGNAAKTAGVNMSRGMKEASKAADDVKKKTQEIGKAFSESDYVKAIKEYQKQFSELGKGIDFGNSLEDMEKLSNSLSEKLEDLKKREENFINLGISDPGGKFFENEQREIAETTNKLKELESQMKKVASETSSKVTAQEPSITMPKSSGWTQAEAQATLLAMQKATQEYDQQISKVTSLVGKTNAYKTALSQKSTGLDDDSQKTDSLGNKVDSLRKKLSELSNQGLNFGDADFDKTYQDLNKAEKELSEYKNGLIETKTWQEKLAQSNPFSKLSAMASSAASKIKAFASSFANGISGVTKMGQSVDNLTSKLAKLLIGFQALKGIGKTLLGSIESASDYIEGYNYFDVAFTKIADESKNQFKQYGYDDAQSYADSFEQRLKTLNSKLTGFDIDKSGELSMSGGKSLGMDITQMTQYEAQVGQMTNSVGMMGEASLTSAKAMARLAGDMSSLTNMPIEQVMQNFTSGLSGMAMAVKKYGIDITQATLQEYAYKLGVDKKVATMTQAEKTYLREIAIVQQSKVAWGDQSDTINQLANQYRMLQAGLKNTAILIGRLLKPAVEAVLPYLNAMVLAINEGLSYIGKLAGIKFNDTKIKTPELDVSGADSWDDMDSAVEDTTKNIEKADKAQKKFNKQLQGFDKLNNLTTTKNDGGKTPSASTGSGGDGDVSGLLNDALLKSLADYEKYWNKHFKNMQNDAENLKDKIKELVQTAWNTGNGFEIGATIANGLNKAVQAVNDGIPALAEKMNKIAQIIGTALNGFVDTFDWAGFGLAIGRLLRTALETAQTFMESVNWLHIGESIATALDSLVASGVIEQAFSTLGTYLRSMIDMAFGFLTEFDYAQFGIRIGKGINEMLAKMFEVNPENGLNRFQELGKALSDGIRGLMTTITNAIRQLNPADVGKAISDFLGSIDFAGIAQDFSTLAITLLDYLRNAIAGINWEEIGQDIGIFIQNIDWKGIFSGMSGLALALITGIANAIKGFASESPIGAAIAGLFAAPKIITAISGIVNLITGIASTVETVVGTIQVLLGAISAPVAGIVATVALVSVALVDLWNTSETFRNSVVEAFTKVKDAVVTTFAEKIIPTIKEVASSIAGFAASIIDFYENSPLKAIVALLASLAVTAGGNVLATAITAIGTAFKGLGKFVSGIIDELSGILDVLTGLMSLDFDKVGKGFKKIGTGIKKAMSGILTIVAGVGLDLINGLLGGIVGGLKTIASWVKEHIFDPIVDNVKKLFGIHSPSTVFSELGGYMVDGLKDGLSGIWESIKGIFTGLWSSLKSWWETNVKLPEIKLPSAEDVKQKIDSIKQKWEGWKASGKELIAEAKEKKEGALQGLKDGWNNWKANSKELVAEAKEKNEGALQGLKDKWDSFSGGVKELIVSAKEKKDATISKIKDAWNDWKPDGKTLETKVASIKDKISSAWSSAKEWWSQHVKLPQIKFPEILKTTVKKWLKPIVEVANAIIEKINDLLHIEWKDIKIAGKTIIKGGSFTIAKIPKIPDSFATGGYPKSKELFYANENGRAELIGRQGNRATVVNNDQIIKSVSAGVSDAVFNSMNPVLTHLVASINKMNNSNTGTPLYVEGVNEGDIVRITTDANRDYKNRTGRPLYA